MDSPSIEQLEQRLAELGATRRFAVDSAREIIKIANERYDTEAIPLMRQIAELRQTQPRPKTRRQSYPKPMPRPDANPEWSEAEQVEFYRLQEQYYDGAK